MPLIIPRGIGLLVAWLGPIVGDKCVIIVFNTISSDMELTLDVVLAIIIKSIRRY